MSPTPRRAAALLGLSLGLHALLLAAMLAVRPVGSPTPLLIDLAALERPVAPDPAPAPGATPAPPGPAGRAAGVPRQAPPRPAGGLVPAPPPSPPLPGAAMPSAVDPSASPPRVVAPTPPAPPGSSVSGAMVAAPVPEAAEPTIVPEVPAPPAPDPVATGGAPAAARDAGAAAAASGTSRGTEETSAPGAVGGPSGSRLALVGPGEGRGGVPPEYAPYLAAFRQRVEAALVYPLSARRAGHGGRVELEVLLDPTGRVRRVAVAQSSTRAALDEAALDAVRSVAPVPFPESLPRRPLLLRLPLIFELR